MLIQSLDIPTEEINRFCQRWQVAELSIFGSALRQDFSPESDIDILIAFHKTTRRGLFDLVRMQREIESILGRKVDLLEKSAVENSENYIRRNEILNTAHVIYPT